MAGLPQQGTHVAVPREQRHAPMDSRGAPMSSIAAFQDDSADRQIVPGRRRRMAGVLTQVCGLEQSSVAAAWHPTMGPRHLHVMVALGRPHGSPRTGVVQTLGVGRRLVAPQSRVAGNGTIRFSKRRRRNQGDTGSGMQKASLASGTSHDAGRARSTRRRSFRRSCRLDKHNETTLPAYPHTTS